MSESLKLFERYNVISNLYNYVESVLSEATQYNTKSKEEYADDEEYKHAVHDDISTVSAALEKLKYTMNTDEFVEVLNKYIDTIRSDLLANAYKLTESLNLQEKINKDNIEINKAMANLRDKTNRDKVKAAGYDVDKEGNFPDAKYVVRNPETGVEVTPNAGRYDLNRDKYDFKNKLDTDRGPSYIIHNQGREHNHIPKSQRTQGSSVYSEYREDPMVHYDRRLGHSKSISKNINDYKLADKEQKADIINSAKNKRAKKENSNIIKESSIDLGIFELDMYIDSNSEADVINEVKEIMTPIQCIVKVVELHGPAGGNPIVQIIGDKDEITKKLVEEGFADDVNDALKFLV